MHVCGIIAEYNPFHAGHAYQIAQARRQSGCDYVIAVMSGDFVQRGAPAIMDKYVRAQMALEHGADLVLMLPVSGSTASAEGFARAGIAALHTTGVTGCISFGCEDVRICSDEYRSLAARLNTEDDGFYRILRAEMSRGISYAAARTRAMQAVAPDADVSLLDTPNNLLAFEYLRAIADICPDLQPCPVRRCGGYHGTDTDAHSFASASMCRTALLSGHDMSGLCLPADIGQQLNDYHAAFPWLCEDDLSAMLHYALLSDRDGGFSRYADTGMELSARIGHALPDYRSFSQFCGLLKNKSVTYTRVARTLTHILLKLPAQPAAPLLLPDGTLPYLRVLGFRRDAAGLMHALKAHAAAPLITRPAQAKKLLTQDALQYFSQDLYAADIYRGALLHKCGHTLPHDCRRQIEIV